MNILLSFAGLIIIMILIKFVHKKKNKRLYELLRQFPSYPTYSLLGNALLTFGSYEDLLVIIEKLFQPYDRLVFWVGHIPIFVIKKFDDMVIILNQSTDRYTYNFADEWFGNGLLNINHTEWKKSRKVLAPAFSLEMLSKYIEVFNKKASKLVEKLKSVADTDEEVDLSHYEWNTALESILDNSTGISIKSTGKCGEDFCKFLLEGFFNVTVRALSPWLHLHYVYVIYLKITGKFKFIKKIKYLPNKILKDYKNDLRNRNYTLNDDSPKTILNQLIKENIKDPVSFSETRIRDELIQLFSGIGTSTNALRFLMLMLAMHQDIQQKVYEEISQLLGDDDPLTDDHLYNHLKYLDQCIKETIRMFSPVTMTTRRTHKELLLKDNTIVPANILVVAMIHLAHYDPEFYKNPRKWDPEHFSEEAVAERPKGSSQLSFGFGSRYCIGAKYAVLYIKTQTCHIIRNYHLSTHIKGLTSEDLRMDLTIACKKGYPIKFTSRKKVKL